MEKKNLDFWRDLPTEDFVFMFCAYACTLGLIIPVVWVLEFLVNRAWPWCKSVGWPGTKRVAFLMKFVFLFALGR